MCEKMEDGSWKLDDGRWRKGLWTIQPSAAVETRTLEHPSSLQLRDKPQPVRSNILIRNGIYFELPYLLLIFHFYLLIYLLFTGYRSMISYTAGCRLSCA